MQSEQTPGQLLREADQALYADKHERRRGIEPAPE
jgi:GGDEF domain-containing protein